MINFRKSNFNEDYAEILIDNNQKVIKLIWKTYVNFEEYKFTFENAYKISKRNKLKFWISDMRNGKAVTIKAQKWLRNIFIPKIVQLGFTKIELL